MNLEKLITVNPYRFPDHTEVNAIALSKESTHSLQMALQDLEKPYMRQQFGTDCNILASHIYNELETRDKINRLLRNAGNEVMGQIFTRVSSYQPSADFNFSGITARCSTWARAIDECRSFTDCRNVPGFKMKPASKQFRKVMRKRFTRKPRRSLLNIEESVPVDQYGTDEYE